MFDFKIVFSQPWLLMLLIPAAVLGLYPYFRIAKKYRRNRNRVVSTVLHMVVLVLSIFVLSGMKFEYKEYNSNNEILFVVDASFSTQEEEEAKTSYMRDVVAMSDSNVFNIGIVTFGYDQQYAVPITNDLDSIFVAYDNAPPPDTSATDIASALTYAKDLFHNPESAKIVLISDGLETDERAASVVRSIAAEGIAIDTVSCSTLVADTEALIVGAKFPEYNLADGDEFDITLTVKSTGSVGDPRKASISYYDGNVFQGSVDVDLVSARQDVVITHKLEGKGLHPLRFEVACDGDSVDQNNAVYSYLYVETFDQVLVIESEAAISDSLLELLDDMQVKVINTASGVFPQALDELREFDQIILNNVANADMPKEFVELLNSYVYDIGGGLFTVGGGEAGDPETAHAYNRKDMGGSLYQQMLPVQAINYTPPLGLAVIIDVSGSMGSTESETSKVTAAKNSARTLVRDETCLTERDYCAVLTLSDSYTEEIPLIPMTRQNEILDAIYNVGGGGGTLFSPSIERAAMDLIALKNRGAIEKMHVIMITDGAVSESDIGYIDLVEKYHQLGVSFTFVAIDASVGSMDQLKTAAEKGGGQAINSTASDLSIKLKDDIRVPEIKEVEYGEFVPTLDTDSYYASVIKQEDMPKLDGFYGTKARSSADVILTGNYNVPIYAEWKYGSGTVGSFMCDLNGTWSGDFLAQDSGRNFLKSVINRIFPTENIHPLDIDVRMSEGNYTTQLSLFPTGGLKEGESIRVDIANLTNPEIKVPVTEPTAGDGFSRSSFVTLDAGVYGITVERVGADGSTDPEKTVTVYKAFSYSQEYAFTDEVEAGVRYMALLAQNGNGKASLLDSATPWSVFENFTTYFDREADPSLAFMIIAIVLFLLDIAVRKFKFKWPHELIREYKQKKAEKGETGGSDR